MSGKYNFDAGDAIVSEDSDGLAIAFRGCDHVEQFGRRGDPVVIQESIDRHASGGCRQPGRDFGAELAGLFQRRAL